MLDYITSLPLLPPNSSTLDSETSDPENGDTVSQEEQAGEVMRTAIDFLNEVDRAWRVVLKGNAWVMDNTTSTGQAVRVDYAGTVGQTERSVFPPPCVMMRT